MKKVILNFQITCKVIDPNYLNKEPLATDSDVFLGQSCSTNNLKMRYIDDHIESCTNMAI